MPLRSRPIGAAPTGAAPTGAAPIGAGAAGLALIAALLAALVTVGAAEPARAATLDVDLGRGPVTVHYPDGNDADHPAPLLILLHGYTGTGRGQEAYFRLLPHVEREGFVYAHPDGIEDLTGNQFWNATDACCDLYGNGVDDSAYLLALVAEIREQLAIDPWRVHFAGHSNGGFMSYRMACDHADVVASLSSLAGATFDDASDCEAAGPVHVLQVHGTADGVIFYDGGFIGIDSYPGAVETTESWAAKNECELSADGSAPNRDLEAGITGAESSVTRYPQGCEPASSAELWTIPGGAHSPDLSAGFSEGLVEFARTHRKAGLVFEGKQALAWPPLRWAEEYRVHRGLIAELRDDDRDGLPDSGYGDCISESDPDATDTRLSLAGLPGEDAIPPGGWFYLVGFRDSEARESILGTTSEGRARWPALSCP